MDNIKMELLEFSGSKGEKKYHLEKKTNKQIKYLQARKMTIGRLGNGILCHKIMKCVHHSQR